MILCLSRKSLFYAIWDMYRVASKPGIPDKPGIWQFSLKKPVKHWNWEILKNLELWTKITKNPGTLNNFYMKSSKILIWHDKFII